MSCLIFDATPRAAATPDGDRGNLIKLLFGNQDVEAMKTSNADSKTGTRTSYVWRIKNKYYSAQVNLDIETNFSNIGESGKQATAVVYFGGKIQKDNSGETLIDSLERWHKAILPQGIQDSRDDERVKLVVFEDMSGDGDSGTEYEACSDRLKEWAIDKGVELVDLSEEGGEDGDGGLFQTGNSRVVDALTAYAGWPPPPPPDSSSSASAGNGDHGGDTNGGGGEDIDEADDPTFETLFSQLAQFRDSADALPNEQRRAMAEDLALKFYAAIGGGESDSENEEQRRGS